MKTTLTKRGEREYRIGKAYRNGYQRRSDVFRVKRAVWLSTTAQVRAVLFVPNLEPQSRTSALRVYRLLLDGCRSITK